MTHHPSPTQRPSVLLRGLVHLGERGVAPSRSLLHWARDLGAMEAMSLGQAPGVFLPRARLAELERQARRLGSLRFQQLLQLAFASDTRIQGHAHGNPRVSFASIGLPTPGDLQPLVPPLL